MLQYESWIDTNTRETVLIAYAIVGAINAHVLRKHNCESAMCHQEHLVKKMYLID